MKLTIGSFRDLVHAVNSAVKAGRRPKAGRASNVPVDDNEAGQSALLILLGQSVLSPRTLADWAMRAFLDEVDGLGVRGDVILAGEDATPAPRPRRSLRLLVVPRDRRADFLATLGERARYSLVLVYAPPPGCEPVEIAKRLNAPVIQLGFGKAAGAQRVRLTRTAPDGTASETKVETAPDYLFLARELGSNPDRFKSQTVALLAERSPEGLRRTTAFMSDFVQDTDGADSKAKFYLLPEPSDAQAETLARSGQLVSTPTAKALLKEVCRTTAVVDLRAERTEDAQGSDWARIAAAIGLPMLDGLEPTALHELRTLLRDRGHWDQARARAAGSRLALLVRANPHEALSEALGLRRAPLGAGRAAPLLDRLAPDQANYARTPDGAALARLIEDGDDEQIYRHACRLAQDPVHGGWAHALAIDSALKLPDAAGAIDLGSEFIRMFPFEADAYLQAARVNALAGAFEAAAVLLDRALALSPTAGRGRIRSHQVLVRAELGVARAPELACYNDAHVLCSANEAQTWCARTRTLVREMITGQGLDKL